MEKTYREETIEIAIERAENLASQFVEEVKHLLSSGAVDDDNHSRGLLFGVALENIAEKFLTGERSTKAYRNLKRF